MPQDPQSERAAAWSWWRTELSGGQLVFNLYVVGALITAITAKIAHARLDPVLPLTFLAGLAFFLKFVIPGVFAAAMLTTTQRRQGLHDTWRYYQWWARSWFALVLALTPGVAIVLAALYAPAPP
jgi:hypothetical protein